MPKVLIFKETLLPRSETFILAQMQALRSWEPLLAGLQPSAPSLPLQSPLMLSQRPGAGGDVRAKLYRRTGIALRFHERARRFGPELVHAHFASGGRTAIPLARALGVPLLVTLHGSDITIHGAGARYKRLAKAAACFICVSDFIRNRAVAAGLPPEKLVVHYIGIDRTRFAAAPGVPRMGVLFVGRLVEKKGCEYLIRAMQLVQRDHPGAELTIVGDGPLRTSLEALAGTLNIRCTFLGMQPGSVVLEQMQKAQVFCAPSVTAASGDSEGLGMVLAEAQATGTPVVATWHGGVSEIVQDGISGLLAPERDYQTLGAKLCMLLADPTLAQKISRAASARIVQRFDLPTQTAALEEIYSSVVHAAAKRRKL